MSDVLPLQTGLYVLANSMLVLLGLYLAGLSSLAACFEVLATALLSGSALQGANMMLAFGADTIPNLALAGLFMNRVTGGRQNCLAGSVALS